MTISRERLEQLHAQGFNCAQCVAAYFSGRTGMDEKTALAVMGGFGGGFRYGGICGAASAAVAALGLSCPHTTPCSPQEKARVSALTVEFTGRFAERFGALDCRELKGKIPCIELICGAAEIVENMLTRA